MLLLAALAACSRGPRDAAPQRLAILPFENLTGDASLDWVGLAAPAIVNADLTGDPKILAFRAENLNAAYGVNASEFLHGYFTGRAGALRFEMEMENASRHKMVNEIAETGSVLSAMNAAAKRFDPSAQPFSTTNPEALAAWGRGDYERAVTLDPGFGAAWLSWTDALASHGQTAEAIEVAHRALAQPSLRAAVDRAKIEVAAAALAGDTSGRARALEKLVALTPNDVPLLTTLAETELRARDFPAAAATFQKILAMDPGSAAAMNSLGYAQAMAGELDAAAKSLDNYGKQPGQKINALDSLGEAYFLNGRFPQAERSFLQAYQQDPSFLAGADLYKAAVARWLSGDLPGADAMFKRFLDSHSLDSHSLDSHSNDALRTWRQASWLYTTGRRQQAIAALATLSDKGLAARQLAIWNAKITADPASLKKRYDASTPPSDGQLRVLYASALAASGDQDEARKILKLWPLPDERSADPLLESLVFPKYLELRKELGLTR
ncbi:MAG TPA: tetratricopeptide repeat protein [Bryobacteraceae bacterium]|nr:tetratricopeptide repeat protein [Bryobacteraceae bacterium]